MVRETVLDNGLKVLVQEVHTAPLASVWCWYRVGSKDEGPGVTGVSHWCEHMNFKGTTNIPRDQVKGIIEKFGGSWNGYTWIDQTTYLETASKDALDQMLFIEAERMDACLYEPADCESERTVIISELQGGENDPEQLLDTEVTSTAFKVHPYHHPTIGWLTDLQTMTRDDLYGHYRRYYVPSNATLVIVGDVDTDDVLKKVEKRFGAISPGARSGAHQAGGAGAASRAARRAAQGRHHRVLESGVPRAVVRRRIVFPAAGRRRGAERRRRPQHLVRRRRVAPAAQRAAVSRARRQGAGVECHRLADADAAPVSLRHLRRRRRRPDARAPSRRSCWRKSIACCTGGITPDELKKVHAQLRARFVYDGDSVTDIAHQIGYFETIASWSAYHSLRNRLDGGHHRTGAGRRREIPDAVEPHDRMV